ncbi:hypothetical protein LTR62_003406 [Meristemomyces frigidus]|uniref:Uncharacterized protein n=1 Tax=Meristemomyces frigidus TaxID=1508187 RepID=A0AAN7YH05_9PEZI|nr:hypothetical protein LTR62_003406 [Meristemomyces frigidus]
MADITQWRRMIQPTRTRTPALEPDMPDEVVVPVTPRRGLKPKISAYFTHHDGGSPQRNPRFVHSIDDLIPPQLPTWPDDEPYPQPRTEGLIDSVMCRLLSKPYAALDARFNGIILQILESHRAALDDTARLQLELNDFVAGRKSMVRNLQQAQKQWADERLAYKAEIKRLELWIAGGAGGLAEVTIARQDSQLRQHENVRRSQQIDASLQAIFDSLERANRLHGKTWSDQRAIFRAKPTSPSAKMRRVSRQLSINDSQDDLMLHIMPQPDQDVLTPDISITEQGRRSSEDVVGIGSRAFSGARTSLSVGTMSTFSCMGDLLPDESSGTINNHFPTPSKSLKKTVRAATQIHKQPSLMSKASGLFHKLMPQNDSTDAKHFSFDPGEEALTLVPIVGLRKSASLPSLSGDCPRMTRPLLSPVPQSPTTSTTFSESRRQSRIPTPVYTSKTMARPRRDRDGTMSPLGQEYMTNEVPEAATTSSTWTLSSGGEPFLSSSTDVRDFDKATSHGMRGQSFSARGNAFAKALLTAKQDATSADRHTYSIRAKRSMRLYRPHFDLGLSGTDESSKENVPPPVLCEIHFEDGDF